MNKVLLEKLRKIIKNVSCNSLKCVYQHQLEEWLEIDSDECSKFIRELVEENLIEEKYDFQCECGNDCIEREKRGECKIIPVIVRACMWDETPLKNFLAFPKDGKSIEQYERKDDAYLEIAKGVREIVQSME